MDERKHSPGRWRELLRKLRTETGESLTEAALTIGVVVLVVGAVIAFVDWSNLTNTVGDALQKAFSPFGGSDSTRTR
jgi:hypothetical protein